MTLMVAAFAAAGAPPAGARTAPVLRVGCNNIILSFASSHAFRPGRLLFGRVVVPPRRIQRGASLHENGWPFFSKWGVAVSTRAAGATITVARGSRREAAISWGNGLPVRRAVDFRRCAGSDHRWNGYAGGLYTRTPRACVGLVVRVGSRSRTIHVGIGRRCSG